MVIEDTLERPLEDLRLSVTDRCNFRCRYCMPREMFGPGFHFLPRGEILSFEEITRLTKLFTTLGVRRLRLTGGEPLLRHELPVLISQLAAIPQIESIALTTNGSLLTPTMARVLHAAGLRHITVSLDALDPQIAGRMAGIPVDPRQILAAIDAADNAGLGPVKINMMVRRGLNDREVVPMARYFRHSGHILRLIEYMDVGTGNGWNRTEMVSAAEARQYIETLWPLEPVAPNRPSATARRYRYRDGGGEIGFIASVTQPFCRNCTRARLTAAGRLYTCLFASEGLDLRAPLRSGMNDDAILHLLRERWIQRTDRYSELRGSIPAPTDKVEMFRVGG